MKKMYVKATLNIIKFENSNIIAASGVNQLTYGGESGTGGKESFDSMFGK